MATLASKIKDTEKLNDKNIVKIAMTKCKKIFLEQYIFQDYLFHLS